MHRQTSFFTKMKIGVDCVDERKCTALFELWISPNLCQGVVLGMGCVFLQFKLFLHWIQSFVLPEVKRCLLLVYYYDNACRHYLVLSPLWKCRILGLWKRCLQLTTSTARSARAVQTQLDMRIWKNINFCLLSGILDTAIWSCPSIFVQSLRKRWQKSRSNFLKYVSTKLYLKVQSVVFH